MRLLWYWSAWAALAFLAIVSWDGSLLSIAFAILLCAFLLALLFLTGLGVWYRLFSREAASERAIRRRDATTESPLEQRIARELDMRGIPYSREHRISRVHVDFAFPAAKLAVECDGWRYHATRKEEDARRDAFLKREGWTVLRFSGDRIRSDAAGCVDEIEKRLR